MISFFTEDITFNLSQKQQAKHWLKSLVENEGKKLGTLSVIFCSDAYLLKMNRQYLQHNYYTDVLTFDYTEGEDIVGDIFISLDTVRANAFAYKQIFEKELFRVIAHGVLHLCGYDDKTSSRRKQMREKEDFYLTRLYYRGG